jgi:hypothetical protein
MQFDMTYARALELAEHLIAVGDTVIYIRERDGEFPYDKVSRIEEGNSWRLNGPSSCYLIVEEVGLTFKLNVDFEQSDANGKGVSLFDRDRLRMLMQRLSPIGREQFAAMLEEKALPGLAARSRELREAMGAQLDSEECVKGLIAYAREPLPTQSESK